MDMSLLSNTAIPKYYGMFRKKVLAGIIPVNIEIELRMNQIDAMIRNPNLYYTPEYVEHWINFCESELTLTDGTDLKLLDSFKLWAEDVYGWWEFVERPLVVPDPVTGKVIQTIRRIPKRLITTQYLIVGRGAAKSLYDTCHQAYGLVCDVSSTQQITTSPTVNQSREVTRPLGTAITRARGPVFKYLTMGSPHNTTGDPLNRQMLQYTKEAIRNNITNSELVIKPMSIDKLQGLRVKYATVDEWLSCDIRENPIEAIEQGASKNFNYLIINTSSEGTVRNGVGDDIKMELSKILRGEYNNPHVSIWWYKLDDIKEVSDPAMWVKANPNIGQTISYDTLQLAVDKAEKNPSERNDILAKRFGIPMEGHVFFFTYADIQLHSKRVYWGCPCALGADLSQGDDFCSFTFMFPNRNGTYGIKCRNYISQRTWDKLGRSIRVLYERFVNEGSLVVMPGTTLDIPMIYDDLYKHIDQMGYDVLAFGYDPYNAGKFVELWVRDHSAYTVVKVIQGSRTESVPLGELKQMANDRLLIFDEEAFSFAMGNCVVIEDTNGNRKLHKLRRKDKIDPVAACMDAWVALKEHIDFFA